MFAFRCRLAAVALALIAGASPAMVAGALAQSREGPRSETAESEADKAAPVSSEPQTTTASFGDWTLRCERTAGGGDAARVCDVSQSIQDEARGIIAQVSLLRNEAADDLRILVLVPSNITFEKVVTVSGAEDGPSLDLGWRRCLPIGCVADETIPADTLKAWRRQDGKGKLAYKDAATQDVDVPLSLRGLAQALDALRKQ